MPISPPKSPQAVFKEMGGKTSGFPLSTVVSSISPNVFPRTWQVGAVTQVTTTLAVGGLSSGATQVATATVALAPNNLTSPNASPLNPISLGVGQMAYIVLSVFLLPPATGNPPTSPFFGMPYVRLSFLTGTPTRPVSGGSTFMLQGPNTYSGPTAIVSIPVYAPATFSATSVLVSVSAILFGVPS